METNQSLQSRTRDIYTSNNHPRAKRRDEVRPGLKQTTKTTANNRKIKRERTVVIMYHKPPNVITSHSNADAISKTQIEQTRRTVYEDIYTMKGFVAVADQSKTGNGMSNFEAATNIHSKLHAIGRLDADTTGLLLLTNDGNLVHQVTNPNAKIDNEQSKSVQKTYEALIMGHHELPEASSANNDENYPLLTLLEKGAMLSAKHGGQTKPVDDLTILSHPTASTTLVSITISEGKNRQIRRMFHSIGSGVMKLHRVSVGELSLAGLASSQTTELQVGEWRLLSEDEVRLGLGWECRWLDEVSPASQRRRDSNTRKATKRRRRRR